MKKILLFVLASSISMMTMAQPPMGGGGMRGGMGGPGGGGRPQGGGSTISAAIGAGTNASEAKAVLDAKKALDKAIAASQNAGKAAKAATWTALSDAYVKAYEAPTQNILEGSSASDVNVFLKGQKATGISNKTTADGTEYEVLSYDNKDLYFRNGALDFWVVTKPVVDGALDKAIEANDQISVSAYTNKGDDSKISTPYFLFSNGTELTDDNKTYIDLGYDSNTEPSTQTYTVPEAAAGSTSFKITRSMTGTNLFITKLVVTRGGTTGITEKTVINSVMNNIIFNLAGQKVGADYKGIVIKNGRKFIQK